MLSLYSSKWKAWNKKKPFEYRSYDGILTIVGVLPCNQAIEVVGS